MSWEFTLEELAAVEPLVESAQVDLAREFGPARAADYRVRGILLRLAILALRQVSPDHDTPLVSPKAAVEAPPPRSVMVPKDRRRG